MAVAQLKDAKHIAAVMLVIAQATGYAQQGELERCIVLARAAGMPKDVAGFLYLMEWRNPTEFAGIACVAAETGVKLRYLAPGYVSKEGFEINGKTRLRVAVARSRLDDGTNTILVPVSYEINGTTVQVTRSNLQMLSHLIRAALANE